MKLDIVYVDMDGVLCNYTKAFNEKLIPGKLEFPQSQARFFENLEEIDGAIESFNWLNDNFDVYVLTSPSVNNPLSYSEKRVWIEEHLGMDVVDKLILSPNKSLLKGQYLIDDNLYTNNQFMFDGTVIHFGQDPFFNWDCVVEYFKQI